MVLQCMEYALFWFCAAPIHPPPPPPSLSSRHPRRRRAGRQGTAHPDGGRGGPGRPSGASQPRKEGRPRERGAGLALALALARGWQGGGGRGGRGGRGRSLVKFPRRVRSPLHRGRGQEVRQDYVAASGWHAPLLEPALGPGLQPEPGDVVRAVEHLRG